MEGGGDRKKEDSTALMFTAVEKSTNEEAETAERAGPAMSTADIDAVFFEFLNESSAPAKIESSAPATLRSDEDVVIAALKQDGLEARGVRTAALMPSQSQWLRARAIHSFFKSSDNVDCSIHQLVFKFCDCPPQIFSGKYSRAFSLLTDWGSVVTWGRADSGGDSRGVAEQLSSGVQTVVGNGTAFAAVKVDGSVVTWGDADSGGDSLSVAEQVSSGVQTVVGNKVAFAAVKADGSVVTWGHARTGGDLRGVAEQLAAAF